MIPGSTMPSRPRLADHAALRRHLVAGAERLTVQDLRTGEVFEIGPRAMEIVLCADGTRDLGGVLLEAARRGVFRKVSEVVEALLSLNDRGLLADGIEAGPPPTGRSGDAPLEVLEGFGLTCDASGTCCGAYDSVVFSPEEACLARCLVPDALPDRGPERRVFLPVQGSASPQALAATMVDGRCPFLSGDGRCRLHVAGGHVAKPRGCRIFPATFVDDGTVVRVSVAAECPCVLASVGTTGGAPLVPAGARVEADLLPGSPVVRLPAAVAVTADAAAPREALGAWSRALAVAAGGVRDPLAQLWSLADMARTEGAGAVTPAGAAAALARAAAPGASELGLPIMMLTSSIRGAVESFGAWRAPGDTTRSLAAWLERGARSLLDASVVSGLLEGPGPLLDQERFYFAATLFGHHLAARGRPLETELRYRAVRLLLARQLGRDVPEPCRDHPAAPYPLTVVEMLLRALGAEG